MKLSYRDTPYERYSSAQVSERPLRQEREFEPTDCRKYRGVTYCIAPHPEPVEVPAKVAISKLIYRGVTYYKLSYQGNTLSVNRNV